MKQTARQVSFDQAATRPTPILRELAFLAKHTGQDELSLLSQALNLGLGMLYRQTVEEAFITGNLSRDDAVAALGAQRVIDIEYAKRSLAQDVARGLGL